MTDFHIKEIGLHDDEKLCLCPITGLMWILIDSANSLELIITPEAMYYLKRWQNPDGTRDLVKSNSWHWYAAINVVYGGRCLDDLELRSPDPQVLSQIPEEHKVPCPTFYSEE